MPRSNFLSNKQIFNGCCVCIATLHVMSHVYLKLLSGYFDIYLGSRNSSGSDRCIYNLSDLIILYTNCAVSLTTLIRVKSKHIFVLGVWTLNRQCKMYWIMPQLQKYQHVECLNLTSYVCVCVHCARGVVAAHV